MSLSDAFIPIGNYPPLTSAQLDPTGQNILLDYQNLNYTTFLQNLLNGCVITYLPLVENLPVISANDIATVDQARVYITYDQLQAAVQSLGIGLTSTQLSELLAHLTDYNNPHQVSAAQVGLGLVANLLPVNSTDITNRNFAQKYITYDQLKAAVLSLNLQRYLPTFNALTGLYNAANNSIVLTVSFDALNGYTMTNTSVTFQMMNNSAQSPVWQTISSVPYNSTLTDYMATVSGLALGDNYTFQALLTDSTNAQLNVTSSSLNVRIAT